MIPKVEGHNSTPPDQGKDANYILDWALEVYRYSMGEHERSWCADHFVFYQHFKNYVDPRTDLDNFRSNIGVGLALPIVKIISATLMAPWQAGDRIIDATALTQDGQRKEEIVAAYVNDVLVNKIPQLFSRTELVKESAIALGRGILKPRVATTPKMSKLQRVMRSIMGHVMPGGQGLTVQPTLQFQEVPPSRYFTMDYVDPFNFWWTGAGRWFNGPDLTCERMYYTHTAVIKKIMSGEWTAPKEPVSVGDALGYDDYTIKRGDMNGSDAVSAADNRTPNLHRVIEIQGWCETKKKKDGYPVYEQKLLHILDEKYLVRNETLATWDGKPGYIVFEPMQDFGSDRPMGVIEPIEQALLTMNDFINIALDNARMVLETPLIADPSMTDQKEIYIGPGEVNWFRNPQNAIQALRMPDLPRSFFELIGFFNDLMQRITGVSDYFGGMNTADSTRLTKTAKGMELMTNLATKRFAPLLTKMDYELYRPMAQWVHETAKLRLNKNTKLRIPNADSSFSEMTPADLDHELKFTFNTKALDLAAGRRRQEFVEMMGMLHNMMQTPMAQQQGVFVDVFESARMLLDEFDKEQGLEALVKKVEAAPMPTEDGRGPFATPGQASLPGRPMAPVQ